MQPILFIPSLPPFGMSLSPPPSRLCPTAHLSVALASGVLAAQLLTADLSPQSAPRLPNESPQAASPETSLLEVEDEQPRTQMSEDVLIVPKGSDLDMLLRGLPPGGSVEPKTHGL